MARKKRKKQYFGQVEEQAVRDYIVTKSSDKRHQLYNDILRLPFKKMVESILRKYPIHVGNYDIHEVEANALSHLIEHMIKYRPFIVEYRKKDSTGKWDKSKTNKFLSKKEAEDKIKELKNDKKNDSKDYRIFEARAFSYCQTIVRNFYKDHSKKTYNEKKSILSFEDHAKEVITKSDYIYEMDDNNKSDLEELIDIVVDEIKEKIDSDKSLKKNEIIVGEAIINVLSNWHILFMEESPEGYINKKVTNKYQKNKILQLLKEQTRLNTKEIRSSMKPFKDIYFFKKTEFFSDE